MQGRERLPRCCSMPNTALQDNSSILPFNDVEAERLKIEESYFGGGNAGH